MSTGKFLESSRRAILAGVLLVGRLCVLKQSANNHTPLSKTGNRFPPWPREYISRILRFPGVAGEHPGRAHAPAGDPVARHGVLACRAPGSNSNGNGNGNSNSNSNSNSIGAKDYTPDVTKVNFHRNMPLKICWLVPVKIHWASDTPLENTTEQRNSVGRCH